MTRGRRFRFATGKTDSPRGAGNCAISPDAPAPAREPQTPAFPVRAPHGAGRNDSLRGAGNCAISPDAPAPAREPQTPAFPVRAPHGA
ncbi:hypothetical protein ACFT1B_22570, partial [Streptomyces griseoincarnatus]